MNGLKITPHWVAQELQKSGRLHFCVIQAQISSNFCELAEIWAIVGLTDITYLNKLTGPSVPSVPVTNSQQGGHANGNRIQKSFFLEISTVQNSLMKRDFVNICNTAVILLQSTEFSLQPPLMIWVLGCMEADSLKKFCLISGMVIHNIEH